MDRKEKRNVEEKEMISRMKYDLQRMADDVYNDVKTECLTLSSNSSSLKSVEASSALNKFQSMFTFSKSDFLLLRA